MVHLPETALATPRRPGDVASSIGESAGSLKGEHPSRWNVKFRIWSGAFERGHPTRRDLIRSLSVLFRRQCSVTRVSAHHAGVPRNRHQSHLVLRSRTTNGTRDFYAGLLGARVANDLLRNAQCELHIGQSYILPRTARRGRRPPVVDHVAVSLADWDKSSRRGRTRTPRPSSSRRRHSSGRQRPHLRSRRFRPQLVNEKVTSSIRQPRRRRRSATDLAAHIKISAIEMSRGRCPRLTEGRTSVLRLVLAAAPACSTRRCVARSWMPTRMSSKSE